jgi:hypothetical protein
VSTKAGAIHNDDVLSLSSYNSKNFTMSESSESISVSDCISKSSSAAEFFIRLGSVVLVDDGGQLQEAIVKKIKSSDIAEVVFRDDESNSLREIHRSKITRLIGD